MNILVVGTGYVGTTTGLIFAEHGHKVTGVDIDENKIVNLQAGKLHFYEKGLEELLNKHLQQNNITFTTHIEQCIGDHDVIYICVGTPQKEDGSANLRYLEEVARSIGKYMNGYKTIVTKSTVPVGTAEKVTKWIEEEQVTLYEFDVVSNPEFLREGSALHDALNPDRIVVGALTKRAFEQMRSLFGKVTCPYVETTPRAAELIKYAANSFLALKISYINELARLCDQLNINVKDVAMGMGLDKRIGSQFLGAGIGYGGSCFPKDVNALLNTGHVNAVPLTILKSAVEVNQTQPFYVLKKMEHVLGNWIGKTVAVLGLSFKAGTDDMRESPSLIVIDYLLKQGVHVKVHDPVVRWSSDKVLQFQSIEETIADSDAVLICTDWNQYKEFSWGAVKTLMKEPIIFDGRNCLDQEELQNLAVVYHGVACQL
ncbi:UDP-glucose/GDP-mannose dehydrogenase family protein [Ectobacillus antri]|jgi:UDPglucose 6-dehydrogenase|uniref:UDP-glucose 6-dehydrogenase n=1 Tax=Ectobacillus antri TaxID=2486280 RepID=A0ABT6H5L0_9BACI|nr:UDP-glucose/GDP-mannose dehydrogenase family protein [Ectobacillus antri]MDG4656628.1 UDP-glucose/GDP-mannose dehydrogenase family protein [Ectobacillus antri]MDG5754009.1 UDP-glucose/GDP-mannose dehydrogenase family protein [Ectobacillus antri]